MDISETEAAVTSQLPSGFIYPKKYASGTHRVWLKNLITNGDFLKGYSPWYANGGNASLDNNKFVNTVNLKVSYDSIYQYIQDYKTIIKDHVYYGFYIVKISVASSDCYALLNDGTTSLRGPYTAVAKDTPTLIPFYFKVQNDGNDKARFLVYPSSVGINVGEKITGYYSILIDLTASYGAGNEPSKAHMDALLMANFPDTQGWFDGNAAVYDFDDQTATNIAPLLDPITTTNRTFTIEGTKPVQVTNLVKNGNFANGTTGWIADGVTMSVSNNILAYTAKRQYAKAYSSSMDSLMNISGHKVYARQRLKSDSTSLRLLGYNGTTYDFVLHSNGSSEWQTLSGIMTAGPSTNYVFSDDPRTSDWTPIYLTDVVWVDLTADFGAGNEPTKDQMDAWLNSQFSDSDGWFDGTNTILTNTSASSVSNNSYLTDLKLKGNTILDASNETRLPITGYNNITNLITNGNFASTSSWWASPGSFTISGNVGTSTGTGTGVYNTLVQSVNASNMAHKFYVSADVWRDAHDGWENFLFVYNQYDSSDNFLGQEIDTLQEDSTASLTKTRYSIVRSLSYTAAVRFNFFVQCSWTSADYQNGGVLHVANAIIIDLTAAYGEGNEPTKDQMDEILATRLYPTTDGWFDGTNSKIVNSPDSGIYESIIGRCDKPFKTTRAFVSPYSQGEQISDNTFGMGLYWITKDHYYLAAIKESTSGSNHFINTSNGNSGNIKGGTLTYDSAEKVAYGLMKGLADGYDNITFSYDYSAGDDMVAEWIVVMDITEYGFAAADYAMAYSFFKNIGFTNLAHGLKIGKPRGDIFRNLLGKQNTETTGTIVGSLFLNPGFSGGFVGAPLKKIALITGHTYLVVINASITDATGLRVAGISGATVNKSSYYKSGNIYLLSVTFTITNNTLISDIPIVFIGASGDITLNSDSQLIRSMICMDQTQMGYSSYTVSQMFDIISKYIPNLANGDIIKLQPDTRSIGDGKLNLYDPSLISNASADYGAVITMNDSFNGFTIKTTGKAASTENFAQYKAKLSDLGLKEGDTISLSGFVYIKGACVSYTRFAAYDSSLTRIGYKDGKFRFDYDEPDFVEYYTIPTGAYYIYIFFSLGQYSSVEPAGYEVDYRNVCIYKINPGEPGEFNYSLANLGKKTSRSFRIANSPINHLDINKINKISTSVRRHYIDSSYYNPIGYMTITNTEATSTNSYILYKVNLSDIGIDPGKAYVFSINLRSSTGLSTTAQTGIQIRFYDSNGTALTPYMAILSGYANRLRYYVIPSGAYSMDVVFRINDSSAMAVGATAVFDKLFVGSFDSDYEPARSTDYYDVNLKTSLSRAWQNNETLMKAEQVMSVYDTLDYSRCYSYKITASRDYSTNWNTSTNGLLGFYTDDAIWSVIDESTESIIECSSGETNALTPIKAGTKAGISTSSTGRIDGRQANPDKTYLTGGIVGDLNYSYIWHERDYMPDIKLYPDTTNIITIEDDNGLAPSEISYRYLANGEA